MSWYVAQAWVKVLSFNTNHAFLGVWRAQRGPGPWSIFFLREDGQTVELWASADGRLYGKRLATGGDN
ncbi:MAG: hypothetical protein ACXWPI_00190 [Ktedonobacterales bacterium]